MRLEKWSDKVLKKLHSNFITQFNFFLDFLLVYGYTFISKNERMNLFRI